MNESKKLLIGFGIISLFCCCLAAAGFLGVRQLGNQMADSINSDPVAIAEAQNKIAQFEIPPNYRPMSMSIFVYDFFYLIPEYGDAPMIMFMQSDSFSLGNPDDMKEALRDAAEQQNPQPGLVMQVVDEFETTIRGQTVPVTVSEGSSQGLTMRQWITVFEGNNGPVVMLIQGTVTGWDDQMIEDFIKSIK